MTEIDSPPSPVDPRRLDAVIEETCTTILAGFEPTGRFLAPGDTGLTSTLYVVATFAFLGKLDTLDGSGIAWAIREYQLESGAFPNYPSDAVGDPWVSALAVGALKLLADEKNVEPIARAERYLASMGGEATVADGIYRLNVNPLFLALAGQHDPAQLPHLPVEPLLLHPVMERARRHVNVACLWMGVAIWAIVRHLQRPDDRGSPSFLESFERRRALEILEQFQNPNGSFNSTVLQTSLAAAAYHCLGVPVDDGRIESALKWLKGCASDNNKLATAAPPGSAPVSFHAFQTAVWTTALMLRALFCAGVSRSHPVVGRALDWLIQAQVKQDLPPLVPTPPGAPRQGGWAFESENFTVPDSDDSAVVIATLGLALQGSEGDRLDDERAARVRASGEKGLEYLFGMQNPDGGWPAFQQGLGSKPRGPILVTYPHFERGHFLEEAATAAKNSLVFGDPATEDITARALFALAQHGFTKDAPVVKRAIAFLEAQQCVAEDLGGAPEHGGGGPWWSRWIANYLTATSYVLGGLAAVGVATDTPMVRRAIDWVLRRQNPDGGWGEQAISYKDPTQAGRGPSMPVATGIVLCGLIQAGEAMNPAVARGIQYLLDSPRDAQGMWQDAGPLHVFYRTDTFFTFIGARYYYPFEALSRYRAVLAGRAPRVAVGDVALTARVSAVRSDAPGERPAARNADGSWSPAGLQAMRQVGDPEADAVVRAIFAAGDLRAINDLMTRIVRNDDPVPIGLPPEAMAFFERTASLPSWADPVLLARASRMFTRVGWATGIALFNAALPQCYAGANGARVLLGTRGLVDEPVRRVVETAQFIIDVTSEGGFEPGGIGVRAAQKVRLLHAAIRHLTLQQATWDMAAGVPINQEDEAGTLITFSIVINDAWKKMGIPFEAGDDAAWLHLWRVVGFVMGVDPTLLPRDEADGRALWEEIKRTQWASSLEGHALTKSLVAMSEHYIPHLRGAALPQTMMRHFCGDRCADLLGLPKADWTVAVLHTAAYLESLGGDPTHESRVRALLDKASNDLMKGVILAERAGKQTRFRIPDALVHAWNLRD